MNSKAVFIVLSLILSLSGCEEKQPQKDKNVPPEARYYKGPKGAFWIAVVVKDTNMFETFIYSTEDGSSEFAAQFTTSDKLHYNYEPDLYEHILFYDGRDKIYIYDDVKGVYYAKAVYPPYGGRLWNKRRDQNDTLESK